MRKRQCVAFAHGPLIARQPIAHPRAQRRIARAFVNSLCHLAYTCLYNQAYPVDAHMG